MANTAMTYLARKLEENPRLPASTAIVIRALSTGEEAASVWRLFGDDEAMVNRVVDRIRAAFEHASAEVSRPPVTHEREDIEAVMNLAARLKSAIVSSSLPKGRAWLDRYQLSALNRPDIEVDIGWHGLRPDIDWHGYPLAITDVLDAAIGLAQLHLDGLPARSLVRQSGKPDLRAFVRHLDWQFRREFDERHLTAIAHIATAIFNPDNPLDRKDVEGLLKDSPLAPPK